MMVIFLYNNRTQTLPCHMALDTLQAARDTVPVQNAPDFHRPIALLGFVKYLFYPAAEFLIRFSVGLRVHEPEPCNRLLLGNFRALQSWDTVVLV